MYADIFLILYLLRCAELAIGKSVGERDEFSFGHKQGFILFYIQLSL